MSLQRVPLESGAAVWGPNLRLAAGKGFQSVPSICVPKMAEFSIHHLSIYFSFTLNLNQCESKSYIQLNLNLAGPGWALLCLALVWLDPHLLHASLILLGPVAWLKRPALPRLKAGG